MRASLLYGYDLPSGLRIIPFASISDDGRDSSDANGIDIVAVSIFKSLS